jgi:DNA-binding NtrC family response regulator
MHRRLILVVDDDPEMGQCLVDVLKTSETFCELVTSGHAALATARQREFDVVVSDVRMAGMDGVELMTRLRNVQPELPVILVTAEGTIPAAVEAVRRGAFDYVTKPCEGPALRALVDRALASRARVRSSPRLQRALPVGTEELIGRSPAMEELRARIQLVAAATSPVLVLGETGTGKELVARAIHACSPRHARPFVTVNTAAIPDSLLESEMFGHARGAFTGAAQAHRGLLAEADTGTLLLDEIGDMPLALQAKLLRVLQTGELRSVGADRVQHVDVRVVAATHRNLRDLVKQGRFREDLFYRLNVITLSVPPLRARAGDIPELAQRFLARGREHAPESRVRSISDELLALLGTGTWPGNVRELQSAIERLVVLAVADRLEPRHLALLEDPDDSVEGHRFVNGSTSSTASSGASSSSSSPGRPSTSTGVPGAPSWGIDELVRGHVDAVLAHTAGNKSQAAKLLGIDLSTLYRWQQKWQSSGEAPVSRPLARSPGAAEADFASSRPPPQDPAR